MAGGSNCVAEAPLAPFSSTLNVVWQQALTAYSEFVTVLLL
jgi:hypothetical protein